MKTLRNKVQLIGNLGADPEVKELTDGKTIAKLSLATVDTYKKASGEKVTETQWHIPFLTSLSYYLFLYGEK